MAVQGSIKDVATEGEAAVQCSVLIAPKMKRRRKGFQMRSGCLMKKGKKGLPLNLCPREGAKVEAG